jgi:hypothetical protein
VDVTLETKCWERDWVAVLCPDRLRRLTTMNRCAFAERVVMINNVSDYGRVAECAERVVKAGALDRFVVVKDFAAEALEFFNLTADSFGSGYVYSIAELVGIYTCRTPFLLHFAGDCMPTDACDWVPKAIAAFDATPQLRVANLTWNGRYDQAAVESESRDADFYYGFGFSDQNYLVRTADFRDPIYGETHAAAARYPAYGGELFEKRVDSWMRNHGYLRATYKHASYEHVTQGIRQSDGR